MKKIHQNKIKWYAMHNIHHFAKKKSQATWSKEHLKNFPKKCPHFKEKNCEIVNIFGGF
jgi:hypothetical protein